MKRLLAGLLIANLLLAALTLFILPEQVAVHFGAGGHPNGFASREANAALMAGLPLVLFCTFSFLPAVLARTPVHMISLPNKEYWLAPERCAASLRRLGEALCGYGSGLFTFLLVVNLLLVQANRQVPVHLNERFFLAGLAAFLIFTATWLARLFATFRRPA